MRSLYNFVVGRTVDSELPKSKSSAHVGCNNDIARFAAFLTVIFALAGFLGIFLVREASAGNGSSIHYDLSVSLYPIEHRLTVEAKITFLGEYRSESYFLLHKGLNPVSLTHGVGIEREGAPADTATLESFKVILPKGIKSFEMQYGGKIHHALESQGEELRKGFRETPGLISPEGIYLAGDSYWYPRFDKVLVSFNLAVTLPGTWDVVSQGKRTLHQVQSEKRRVRWESPEPQEGIFLIGGQFTEYSRTSDGITAMVFLRAPDEELAERYLAAFFRYLALYEKLIGPYPYKKFATVENFWETGFGMPSFTLLGPKVIRFPFILHSSFPHEILHNWWGNGVFPDYESGNWSEGLTAYLSDHLIKEYDNQGPDYRRDTLQKYSDYVSQEKEFPITQFRSRHSPSTQAVGYGKTLMFFHMLRQRLGDEQFVQGIKHFFKEHKFRLARFDDIRKSFEHVSGLDLRNEFDQWLTWTGGPELKIASADYEPNSDGYVVSLALEQTQAGEAYDLRIPVAVTLEDQERVHESILEMTKKRQEWKLRVPGRPLRLDVDPRYDVFRRLGRNELPPALSRFFGAKSATIVLPSSGDDPLLKAYLDLAETWAKSGPDTVQILRDKDLETLPSEEAVVIVGWQNTFVNRVASALSEYGAELSRHGIRVGNNRLPKDKHSVALTIENPRNPEQVLVFLASENPEALPGLTRKLPHYHKYGYLGFSGNEPFNMLKGRWTVTNSPMTVFFSRDGRVTSVLPMGKLSRREPLEVLPTNSRQ